MRDWCNGSMIAFQATGESSNLLSRLRFHQLKVTLPACQVENMSSSLIGSFQDNLNVEYSDYRWRSDKSSYLLEPAVIAQFGRAPP